MTDLYDRATEREEAERALALAAQDARAGLRGKTVSDSATHCVLCDEDIPQARREALPGVQTCIHCQTDLEKANP
jgi:phage/conjugal plasmid C-4 type zinc finger TraR family protein